MVWRARAPEGTSACNVIDGSDGARNSISRRSRLGRRAEGEPGPIDLFTRNEDVPGACSDELLTACLQRQTVPSLRTAEAPVPLNLLRRVRIRAGARRRSRRRTRSPEAVRIGICFGDRCLPTECALWPARVVVGDVFAQHAFELAAREESSWQPEQPLRGSAAETAGREWDVVVGAIHCAFARRGPRSARF